MRDKRLYLPLSYEEARQEIGRQSADLIQLFHWLPEFEEKVLAVLREVRATGKILFVYGTSGIGKTTFLHSLRYRSFLPIRDVTEVSGFRFESASSLTSKPDTLFEEICAIALRDAEYEDSSQTTCLVLSALEHLEGEDPGSVRKFFMNLNGLLRQYPLLIFWQVNDKNDLETMLSYVRSIATTLISRRQEYLNFTGPKQIHFPEIVVKNVRALHPGRDIYDFQLHDGDLVNALERLQEKKKAEQTIRRYMEIVLETWETRSDYMERMRKSIPMDVELWIVLCHPAAEELVERSTRRSRRTEDYYNVDYAALDDYIKSSKKRSSQWPEGELAWALSIIKTKIIFVGTHAFINAVAAFGPTVPGFPLTEEEVRRWELPSEWYYRRRVALFLSRSPLVRQLALREMRSGTWSRGNRSVEEAIGQASPVFEEINQRLSDTVRKWSDRPFNKALALALAESYSSPLDSADLPQDRPRLSFEAEVEHPHLGLRPDILVTNHTNGKTICLEMFYTTSAHQYRISEYTLDKLKDYWDQVRGLFHQPRLPFLPASDRIK